jgi:excisionase family DNA binding protein
METLYTVKEVAFQCKVNVKTVYEWFKRGLVKTKIGRITRIKKEDLQKFVESQGVKNG